MVQRTYDKAYSEVLTGAGKAWRREGTAFLPDNLADRWVTHLEYPWRSSPQMQDLEQGRVRGMAISYEPTIIPSYISV